ncbi:MAG: hypothetical protein KKD01_00920 [Proteobacteria bacterium]|nr:hypothetical protein [Pseudomonadota bacterium]MBU1418144.1 hypothetical protein [Pseudomonadota bacterium]MBU1453260.1 hypothetical protein [Pseudomonadota bacterium]
MKKVMCCTTILAIIGLSSPLMAANQMMGGNGGGGGGYTADESGSASGGSGSGGSNSGSTSDAGELYGDLYIIDRYEGTEMKNVPAVDANGDPIMALGDWIDENGAPVIDPSTGLPYQVEIQTWTTAEAVGGEPKLTEAFARYVIVNEDTGEYETNPDTGDIYYPAPYPSQCVQPMADSERWGDIFPKTGLDNNRLPIVMTYDPTWERTECEVDPGLFIASGESWEGITYYKDIYWLDLVQEVEFGRLNLGRAPEAVLAQSFDEAISSINNADAIWLDASGRFVLRTRIFDEFMTDDYGDPLLLETVEKAIDSPKENLALYQKLIKDGHLITPADDREPIDASVNGGIPTWKAIELEDGPSKALRPTIDVAKMIEFGFGYLVDAQNTNTYYTYMDETGGLIVSEAPCEGCEQWYGIQTRSEQDMCSASDFDFTASFLAAAADKTGTMTVDKIVYLNSIMGINKVVGYSAYNEDETPAAGAIDYAKNPMYFDFGLNMNEYDRGATYRARGRVVTPGGGGQPASYDGNTTVLVESDTIGTWVETVVDINEKVFGNQPFTGTNIGGFNGMTDDDLGVIEYIHTYQIPGLR